MHGYAPPPPGLSYHHIQGKPSVLTIHASLQSRRRQCSSIHSTGRRFQGQAHPELRRDPTAWPSTVSLGRRTKLQSTRGSCYAARSLFQLFSTMNYESFFFLYGRTRILYFKSLLLKSLALWVHRPTGDCTCGTKNSNLRNILSLCPWHRDRTYCVTLAGQKLHLYL